MLDLKKVLGAKPKEHVEAELKVMLTPWGEALDCDHVLEEHPDPQFARAGYQVLNGRWSCAFVPSGHDPSDDLESVVKAAAIPAPEEFDGQIVVPFSPEAPLSGVGRQLQPDELLWYRREFEAPGASDGQRLLLHFQAVDYACACWCNGVQVGTHVGGYTPFAFDITDALVPGANELSVCVADPSEFGGRLRGKQRFDRGDIWYTAQSGIWQTVWLEVVAAERIESVVIEASDDGVLSVGARLTDPGVFSLEVLDGDGLPVAAASCEAEGPTCAVALQVPNVHVWSPSDPYLYRLRFAFGEDAVESYCGFRTVEVARDEEGRPRVFLNHEPLFLKGVLDQAYWSDGLMTAPSDEALVSDIQAMRDAGFNMMRKHIKVESARWYYHCDRMGMLVWQDMVSGGDREIKTWQWSYKPTLFKFSWNHYGDTSAAHQRELGAGEAAYRDEWTRACRETVRACGNHPSVITWVLFNEGWGQFDARGAYDMVRALDPTRPVDAVSGWYDQKCGDFSSVHNYFRDLVVWPCRKGRAFVISEFGGFSHRVEDHSSLDEAYGYEIYDDLSEWRRAVKALLEHMDSLEQEGLAGYVYTQVSDIEEEVNGILTYDRRVNKLLP